MPIVPSIIAPPSSLTSAEVANIARALELHVTERGPTIIGAQLGLLISEAIRPKALRDLGGLRRVAVSLLNEYLAPAEQSSSAADITFTIRDSRKRRSTSSHILDQAVEVAGADLWQYFSNPRISCKLAATIAGKVFVMPEQIQPPSGATVFPRPSAEDYKHLASQFAARQEESIRVELMRTFERENFYTIWIAALRKLRTSSANLLRAWETVRAEFVVSKLHEALTFCGIDDAEIAEIVFLSRPTPTPRSLRLPQNLDQQAAVNRSEPVEPELPRSQEHPIVSSDSVALRIWLHSVIDMMDISDLREIRVPAGLFYDASRSTLK